MDILNLLSTELGLKAWQVENTINLLNDAATVPFISRYRKEQTGSLDENQVREIQNKHKYYTELDERRQTILDSIESQGKLTNELEDKIKATHIKAELEDLYLPYKPKRATRASKAKDAGLEPLAVWIQGIRDQDIDILSEAQKYINPEKGFETAEKSIQGALDIFAEEISNNFDMRRWVRTLSWKKGRLVSSVKKGFTDNKTKFQMYYDFSESINSLPSHRILAMLRGEREKILAIKLDIPEKIVLTYLESRFIKHSKSAAYRYLLSAIEDSFSRLILPSIETEVRKELRDRADQEAFKVFGGNLKELILAPPAGHKPVLGVDPGFRTGCKVAALDSMGRFLEYEAIYPNEPKKDIEGAKKTLLRLIKSYDIQLIAIGNGTASRETEHFVKKVLNDCPEKSRPVCVIVNESGASVYSASETAQKEFPDFDVTVRGAISIARRLQDPLSELVKIEPKSIGVGQYQHDVNQTELKSSLEDVVEHCVNLVGVDVNLASEELLKFVSGLNTRIAGHIVKRREGKDSFATRKELLEVPKLGKKAFEQSAGFLRIPDGYNPLDNSAVHPERYKFVDLMAWRLKTTVNDLIGNTALLQSIANDRQMSEEVGPLTYQDILDELEKPGRDPRDSFNYARFSDEITNMSDLEPDMELEGWVTNVTNFGAFVDVGVHQDGLIHISELANRFVKDPKEVVKVGQVVKVKVLSVDEDLKRIALSMKRVEQ